MMDLLDKLQEESGYVMLTLASGEIVFGLPQCIVWEEDDNGMETVKTIMFDPFFGFNSVFYKLEDVKSYEPIDEEDIPPHE